MTPQTLQTPAESALSSETAGSDIAINLERDAYGNLMLTQPDGTRIAVVPVRNFPLSAPEDGISLTDAEGREQRWIDSLALLPRPQRHLIQEVLARRDVIPVITRIVSASGNATPCRWQVETDRGETMLHLNGEEDIRRLTEGRLLVTDACGLQFLIQSQSGLDRHSRRLLDRFL